MESSQEVRVAVSQGYVIEIKMNVTKLQYPESVEHNKVTASIAFKDNFLKF